MRKTFPALVIGATFLTVVACGGPTHDDAPDPAGSSPGTRAHVIQEPDGFRNVSFSCFGPNGVYVTSRSTSNGASSSGVAVVPNDPQCK